ncbi:hypothetical protein Tco_1535169 [Tanacetum coccineum]
MGGYLVSSNGDIWSRGMEYGLKRVKVEMLLQHNEDVDNLKKLIDETTFYDKQWQATWQDEKKEVWRGKWGSLVAESREGGGWEEEVGGVMVVEEIEWKMKKI